MWSRQQAGTNLECSLSEARDELAEMVSTLADARRHLKQAKSKLGDEIDRLRARVGELEVEAVALTSRAEASEKATRAALSSGSVHTDVWDQSPLTKEAQLLAIKEAGEPLLRTFVAELKEARRMAVARKRRGLRRVTMADIVGLLALCSARVEVMHVEATRRRVSLTKQDWAFVEQTLETAELQYMVLREHEETAGMFNESRILMAGVLFGKDAEGWTERNDKGRNLDIFHPGCCHTCGSCMGVNGKQGHDSSLGDKYEGRTLEQCYRLKEIKEAGPCPLCTSLVDFLDGTADGPKGQSSFAKHPVPVGHLEGDCPLGRVGEGSVPRGYMTLQHFAQGLARRKEEKLANTLADIHRRDLLNQQKNAGARERKGHGYFARGKGGPAGPSGFGSDWKAVPSPTKAGGRGVPSPKKQDGDAKGGPSDPPTPSGPPRPNPNHNPNPNPNPDPKPNPNPNPNSNSNPNPNPSLAVLVIWCYGGGLSYSIHLQGHTLMTHRGCTLHILFSCKIITCTPHMQPWSRGAGHVELVTWSAHHRRITQITIASHV